MTHGNCKINEDLFQNVPSEIVIEILLRLPVRSLMSCKCVQKSWLHLVETQEFVESHLSKSTPGMITCENIDSSLVSYLYNFYEFEDVLNVKRNDLNYKLVATFNLTNTGRIMGSVDGLVFLCKKRALHTKCDALYICNPITRHYINLHCPDFGDVYLQTVRYGFGLSKMTKQYKVVRILNKTYGWQKPSEIECYVYTLGTGSWRRHTTRDLLPYRGRIDGAFANGNLHWLALDLRIFCFDLETEQFSSFSTPFPWNEKYKSLSHNNLFLFMRGDCLSLCDNTSSDEIVIWMMKEYGDEKSWTKELVLSNDLKLRGCVYPVKVFKNGDVLFKLDGSFLFYYSSKTKTTQRVDMPKLSCEIYRQAILHTPSFVSLKSFGLDVSSF